MRTIFERIDALQSWGVPQSVLAEPVTAHRDQDGLLHGEYAIHSCKNTTGGDLKSCLFSPTRLSPLDACACLVDLEHLSRHWEALGFCESFWDALQEYDAATSLSERGRRLEALLEAEDQLIPARTILHKWKAHLAEFFEGCAHQVRLRFQSLHAELVAGVPAWYKEWGFDPAADSWSLVGLVGFPLWEFQPAGVHLLLGGLAPRHIYMQGSSGSRTSLVVRVPTVMVAFLQSALAPGHGVKENNMASTSEDTPAVLENLQTLWDPWGDPWGAQLTTSALRSFTNAVSVARSV